MKRLFNLGLGMSIILSAFFAGQAVAQPMYSTGNPPGTGGNTIPFAYSSTGCRGQQVMPAGIFGTPPANQQITKVYWAPTASGTTTYGVLQILLKQANISILTTTYETGMTMVLDTTNYTLTRTAGQYHSFELQTPFPYDPSLPLIWEVRQIQSPYASFSSCVHPTPYPAGAYRNYATNYLATSATGSGAYMLSFGFDLEPIRTAPDDAGIQAILSPVGDCSGDYDVEVRLKNFGTNPVNPVTVEWSVNGVLQTPTTYSSTLDSSGGSGINAVNLVLGQITLTNGISDNIKVWTTNPNNAQDTVNYNDTAYLTTNPLPTVSTFPYYQDFEGGQGDWNASGTNSSWAFGTPAKTYITGAASGSNAFVTGGLSTALYNASENSQVNSPCFDFSGFEGTPWVALDVNWYSEASYDGTALQYTIDAGGSWKTVGKVGDPNNWYTDNSLDARAGGSNDGWAGTGTSSSNGWKRAKHVLDQSLVGKQVRFRMAFGSDASVQYDGTGFDNFTLVDFKQADLGPDVRSLCQTPGVTLDPHVNFNGTIGWSTGDSTNETIIVATPGIYSVTYIDTLINESTSDQIEIIQSAPPVINFVGHQDTIGIDGTTTLNPSLPFDLDYVWTPGGYDFPFYLVNGADVGVGTHLFSVQVTDSVLCEDNATIAITVLDFEGVGEFAGAIVRCYPNPVKDALIIETTGLEGTTQLNVTDINGRVLMTDLIGAAELQRKEIDLYSLPSGTYVLRMVNNNQALIHKIVKE